MPCLGAWWYFFFFVVVRETWVVSTKPGKKHLLLRTARHWTSCTFLLCDFTLSRGQSLSPGGEVESWLAIPYSLETAWLGFWYCNTSPQDVSRISGGCGWEHAVSLSPFSVLFGQKWSEHWEDTGPGRASLGQGSLWGSLSWAVQGGWCIEKPFCPEPTLSKCSGKPTTSFLAKHLWLFHP